MKHRALALLGLIATLTVVGVLLHDRARDAAPAGAETTVELPLARPTAPQPTRAPLGLAEAHPPEPSARSEVPAHLRAKPEPAQELPELEAVDTVLVFRALDGNGHPVLDEITMTTKVRWHRQVNSTEDVALTDAEGHFEVQIDPSLPEGERRELDVDARERHLVTRVDLSRSFPPGRTDMGDLVLTPAPVIAEGRVIDAAKRPVAGTTLIGRSVVALRNDTVRLIEPYYGVATSAEDGTFALYGSTNASRIAITLDHESLLAPSLEFPVGSRGIEIVAQESGGVAGRLIADPGVPVRKLRMILLPENVAAGAKMKTFDSSISSSGEEMDDDGQFEIEGMLPWRYTLAVGIAGDVLAEIHGIEIVSGEITRDPRIQVLDLRGQLHAFTLDLVGPSPSFQLSGSVCYGESGTSDPMRTQHFDYSPVVVVTPLTAIDVMVRARECRIERFSDLAERTEVRLRPALHVRLALPRDVALPTPPLFIGATLVNTDEGPGERALSYSDSLSQSEFSPARPFDEHGEAVCLAYEPGRMRVRWFVERRLAGRGGQSQLDMPFEQAVVVEDRDDEQRIELAVTQQALDSALANR